VHRHGGAASKAELLSAAPGASVLHLATHAYSGEIEPGRAAAAIDLSREFACGVVLAGANRAPQGDPAVNLSAFELAQLDLSRCELAVLSACSTNEGPRNFGEAAAGLNRALRLAGAQNTITSLWPVGDRATADFFAAFYDSLWRERRTIPEAFAFARSAVHDRHGPSAALAFALCESGPPR
jgi:CHAT domain-containing protein